MEEVIIIVMCPRQGSLTDRKLKRSTLSMPRALSCRMTGARFERCISGTVDSGNFSKSSSDKEATVFHKEGIQYNILEYSRVQCCSSAEQCSGAELKIIEDAKN